MLIYCITNLVNGKQYIGLTTQSVRKRFTEHVSRSRYPNKYKSVIHSAIRKYGPENFTIEPVFHAFNMDSLLWAEQVFIKEYNTFLCGYNLTEGGDFKIISEVVKKRISASKIGHKVSEETKRKLSEYNKKTYLVIHPDGTKEVIHGLKDFCAAYGLGLKQMCAVAAGKLKRHCGFYCNKYIQG